jgi:alpha-glucosidase (family GH31 glycosyl hydrolase)
MPTRGGVKSWKKGREGAVNRAGTKSPLKEAFRALMGPVHGIATGRSAGAPKLDPMAVSVGRAITLRRDGLTVVVSLDPLALTVSRRDRELIGELTLFTQPGRGRDRLIELTEGVLVEEELGERAPIETAAAAATEATETVVELDAVTAEGRARVLVRLAARERLELEVHPQPAPFRLGARWRASAGEHLTGLGARHHEGVDQRGRIVRLGADRRYTGPDCPAEMLAEGGIPQGDYAPVPWLNSSAGWAAWVETWGPGLELDLRDPLCVSQRGAAGPLRLRLFCDPTPAARLRHYLRLTGFAALLPEWAYGHWKSRDVYEHQRDVLDDLEGYLEHSLPLDAIVIDSPWATQYNTWRFNPHQFPDPKGMIDRLRAEGVRTVVWVTPWVNLDSTDGQRPPDAESERLHRRPAPNYAEALWAGNFIRGLGGGPYVGRWWMGIGSPVDFSSPAARRWWQKQARRVLEMGVEGIKADDGEGYYIPPGARLADQRTGAEAAWAYGELYRRTMQEALDDVHPGGGVLFGRCGWAGQQAIGFTWGGDQVSDFWSLRTLVVATLTAAASGFSNWSHDVGGYLGKRLVERCPRELLLRWVQFGCFTPLMQAHARFEQEAWRYDHNTLDTYREFVLLHERLVPYIRAAAATAERAGLPIVRPLALSDPGDERGWRLADAYGFGPALWVAPVLEEGAEERRAWLPRGEWIDFWSGERIRGGREVTAPAPRERIPVWVRRGAILVTHPPEHVAAGLGDTPEGERPLEATLWGEPACGRAQARLADGTVVRWRRGEWSVEGGGPARELSFRELG